MRLLRLESLMGELTVPYFDGPRYPHLARVPDAPDTLAEVLEARVRP